ncbi:MAG: hypothetical protein IJL87_10360 [Clostridia bacterium]|nr:hypothetical protein [Clostridia bacterium]
MIAINGFFKFLGVSATLAGAAYLAYKMYDKKFIDKLLDVDDDEFEVYDDRFENDDIEFFDSEAAEEISDDVKEIFEQPEEEEYLSREELIEAEGDNEEDIDSIIQ